ncbi:hypothetical protein FRC14_006615 [Serendipita sp. 396]|nr:hypothetical protein FRC14_006615 [Serendipita sp. 396]
MEKKSSVHAISRNYQLDSFGETHWILLELAPLRKHIPSSTHHESRLGGGASIGGMFGFMNQNVHRTRSRSNSLPWPSPTPDEASGAMSGSGSSGSGSGSGGDSSPSDEGVSVSMSSNSSSGSGNGSGNGNGNGPLREGGVYTHPELHPSHSVTFDRSQAACTSNTMIVPSSPIQAQYLMQQQQQHEERQRGRSGRRRSSQSTTTSSASMFFRQPPMQSIHSLLRARLQCLYTASRSSCRISVRIYFGATGGSKNTADWRFSEGMMVVLDDGQIENDDCWLLGGRGRPYLVCDEEYECSLVSGLAAQGVYTRPAATIRTMRLVRRSSDWDAVLGGGEGGRGDGGVKEWEKVAPQAYLEVMDPKDERLAFSLGPVVFEPEGVKGREWVGTVPHFVY